MTDDLPATRDEMQHALLAAADIEATVLAWSERAGSTLAAVEQVSEAKNVVDAMTVMETVCRVRDAHIEASIAASAMRVRAERRVGQLLREQPKAQGRRTDLLPAGQKVDPTLTEQGITHKESSRFQALADVDDDVFEDALDGVADDVRDRGGGNVTANGVLRRVNPEQEKHTSERYADAELFVVRCESLVKAAEDAVTAIRWGHYPGGLPLIGDSAEKAITAARDACDIALAELRRRTA